MGDILIKIENLSMQYDHNGSKLDVLQDINLSILDGEILSVLGPSGCGKSTLLKLIGGLIRPSKGAISVRGSSPDQARRKREFGFVFQNPVLFNWRNVFRNIMLPAEIFGKEELHASELKSASARKRAYEMIDLVGLRGFERAYPYQLSGGMQSRVAIARVLSYRPSILLMDEPFGDLDELTRTKMNIELMRLWAATKCTIIFVTHSIQEAIFISDRIIVFSSLPGKIIEKVEITIPRPRKLDIQETKDFGDYASFLRNTLGVGVI
jgi:NitT/TauT family transport system ATP-binding protein